MKPLGKKSTVAKASTNSVSLRATIPGEIVSELQLTPGDILDWELTSEKGKKAVRVRKLE